MYCLNHFKHKSSGTKNKHTSVKKRLGSILPILLFVLQHFLDQFWNDAFQICLEWLDLPTFFRLGLKLLLRDSDDLSSWNIFSRTNVDALDCSSFTSLQPLRIISFRYKATLSSSGFQQDQLLDIYGDSCDELKKDEIFNAKDRFVDVIYLMHIIGTNSDVTTKDTAKDDITNLEI